MRKFTLIATIVVLLNAMWVFTTHAQWPRTTLPDSRMSLEFGAKAYDRPGDRNGVPLVTDGDTGSVLFDSRRATDLGGTAGAEVKFNFLSKRGREIEIRSIISEWDESFEFAGSNLTVDALFPGTDPTSVTYDSDADDFSIEMMCRRAITPGLTFMFGPRFVSSKDSVAVSGTRLVDPADGNPPFDLVTSEFTEATNALIGLQSGFEINCPVSQDVYVNGFIRVGGYMNPTEVNQTSTDDFTNVLTTTTQQNTTGSFLGEVGGRLYVDIVPNCFSTFVGYEGTWIDGVALAPAQVLTTGTTGIDTSSTLFFQALTFGIRLTH